MQAVVKTERRAGAVEVRHLPDPRPGPGEALVRVAACGICGSDLHAYQYDPGYETMRIPVVLGHEFAGVVEEIGPAVDAVRPGDRVVMIAIQGCLRCDLCQAGKPHLCHRREVQGLHRDGGMAERVAVREPFLVPVPAGLDLRAAALAEPLSVAVHAVHDRCAVHPGDRVVVTGPGPIGLLCALVARLAGGEVLVAGAAADAATRLPAAARFGFPVANVEETPLREAIRAAFGRPQPDVWIEASGAGPALQAAIELTRRGGVVTVVGLYAKPVEFFPTTPVRNELDLRFSYASFHPDYLTALDLLAAGRIDAAALCEPFPLARGVEAFAAALAKQITKPLLVM